MVIIIRLNFKVISARKGEFETGFERGGQTREHAMLAKTAGVKHLIVLVNKMDDSTVQWSEDRYNECKEKLLPYLKKVSSYMPSLNLICFLSYFLYRDSVFCISYTYLWYMWLYMGHFFFTLFVSSLLRKIFAWIFVLIILL